MSYLPDISRNLLATFFQKQFYESRDNKLRLSVQEVDVQDSNLIGDAFDIILDDAYFNELLEKLADYQKEHPLTQREVDYHTIHYFQTFLYCCFEAGFKVEATPDSEKLFEGDVAFKHSIYDVTYNGSGPCLSLVDKLTEVNTELNLASMIIYLYRFMEFYF